eukprot:702476-Amphidinium_carterae.3
MNQLVYMVMVRPPCGCAALSALTVVRAPGPIAVGQNQRPYRHSPWLTLFVSFLVMLVCNPSVCVESHGSPSTRML